LSPNRLVKLRIVNNCIFSPGYGLNIMKQLHQVKA